MSSGVMFSASAGIAGRLAKTRAPRIALIFMGILHPRVRVWLDSGLKGLWSTGKTGVHDRCPGVYLVVRPPFIYRIML
jgi:hypothetical protein